MISDPIADFLIRIKNISLAGGKSLSVPYSKAKEELAKILVEEGYLSKIEVTGKGVEKKLVVALAENRQSKIVEVKRISKPGRRVYLKAKGIKGFKKGLGTLILSTPKGLMTAEKALAANLGGEAICKVI